MAAAEAAAADASFLAAAALAGCSCGGCGGWGVAAAERERAGVVVLVGLLRVSARAMVPFFPPDLARSWRSCLFLFVGVGV
jgi:hypothetical protein